MEFVPYLNSIEGLSLTPAQWLSTGIQSYGYDVVGLLQRPGYQKQFQLNNDLLCPGKAIIDARKVQINSKGEIQFRSPDGSLKKCTTKELFQWLQQLKPDVVVWDGALDDAQGDFILYSSVQLLKIWNLSNQPASLAYQGQVLHQEGEYFSILSDLFKQDYSLLTADCACQTCRSGLTRAYLHHLLQHTPLLAQRYLVLHNVFQAKLSA